jgi:AcrR family transcriptional regulator
MAHQQRAEETHARLMEAAEACFSEAGYDRTGVAEICERAGVSKGAFYHHFPSKQALFLELLDLWLAGLDAQIALIRTQAVDIPHVLSQVASTVRHVFTAGRGKLPVFLAFWSEAARDEAVWRAVMAHYQRYYAVFEELIAAGIAEGSLEPVDARVTARVLVSLGVGVVLQGVLEADRADWGQVAEQSIQQLLHGLLRRTNDESTADGSIRQCGNQRAR